MTRVSSQTCEAEGQRGDGERAAGWIYDELGVEPIINCTGVRTLYGGSNPAPEVLHAMAAAAEAFVDLDELAEVAGRRLAILTGAPWGVVVSSTTAALTLATAACLAGNDPELMLRLPNTHGMAHRVVMIAGQRFDYDHAIAAAGARIECAANAEQLKHLLDGDTVMVCLLGRADRSSPLSLHRIAPLARAHGVPILVDAAGLSPSKPDPWLAAGADLVVYAGGKYLRGPQSTALLLGQESLCRAVWINGPPHQALGRSMKVGKEEIVGAVVALDRWLNAASAVQERASWLPRLQMIASTLSGMAGVTTMILPSSEAVTAPRIRIEWDPARIALGSDVLRARLLGGSPRIAVHDFWSRPHSVVIDPVNLTDHEALLVARAIRSTLSAPEMPDTLALESLTIDLTGSWQARLTFLHGQSDHQLHLTQRGAELHGRHVARYSTAALTGRVDGKSITLQAKHPGDSQAIYYRFEGERVDGALQGRVLIGAASDEHSGPLFQQQFGNALWRAVRDGAKYAERAS